MAVQNLSSLWQTVVGGFSDATKVLAPTHAAMEAIYWDYNPDQPGAIGQTIDVPFPQDPTNSVQDIGAGNLQLSDINFLTVPIVLNRHPSFAFPVRDFENINTPYNIRKNFVDAAMTGIHNYINTAVASLFTSGNFSVNSTTTGTGGVLTVPNFLAAQAILADKFVPIYDRGMMSLLLPSTPYTKMQDGTTGSAGAAWTQAFIVGERTADDIHRTGNIPVAFNTRFVLDQQMPTTGTVGSRTFTGVYLHKYAVGGVTRPIATPPEAMKVSDTAYFDWNGIPLRVMLGYNQYPVGGMIFQVDCAFGLKVVRPEMADLISIAE